MRRGERTRHAALTQREPIFPRVPLPVNVNDAEAFPLIAEARRHYASLDPKRRAMLEAEWEQR